MCRLIKSPDYYKAKWNTLNDVVCECFLKTAVSGQRAFQFAMDLAARKKNPEQQKNNTLV